MSEEATIELEAELQTIADQLDGLTLLQASKLVKYLEDKWGVSAAAPVAMAVGPAAPAADAAPAVESLLAAVRDPDAGHHALAHRGHGAA